MGQGQVGWGKAVMTCNISIKTFAMGPGDPGPIWATLVEWTEATGFQSRRDVNGHKYMYMCIYIHIHMYTHICIHIYNGTKNI